MTVNKLNELIGSSPHGFEDAARSVVDRAHHTLRGIRGIEVVQKKVKVEQDAIQEYRVHLRLIFEMAPDTLLPG